MSLELSKQLIEFLLSKCYFELEGILAELDCEASYSLYIKVVELFDWNPDFGEECLLRPKKYLKAFEAATEESQAKILLQHDQSERLRSKPRVLARFSELPLTPWTFFERLPTSSSLGKLVSLRGTVIRTGSHKMQEFSKEWQCTRCKSRQTLLADDSQYGVIGKPTMCTGSVDGLVCKNVKFEEIASPHNNHANNHVDYQEVKIQELSSVLEIGAVPRSIVVLLRDDLVDWCRAGDDVIVTGILGCRLRGPMKADASRLDGELFIQASSLQSTASKESQSGAKSAQLNSQSVNSTTFSHFRDYWQPFKTTNEWHGRAQIIQSFCPQIHGMFLVKLATLLTVIGGSGTEEEEEDEGVEAGKENVVKGARKSRREGHLLLVGDPGTGKSQFLVNSARLIDRSVMTTGSGSTMAGLTCSAIKDGSGWQLEAGALVMADRGICCIDEFNALRPQDRTAIHEAMEQQTLSVAKAGLVCKLNTRCSILAACNVKGELEDGKTISSTLALASPLLSRFDLIFLLLDRGKRDAQWDSALCDQLLGIQQEGVDKSNDKNDNTEDNIEGNTVDKSNDKSDNTMGKSGVIPTSTTTTTITTRSSTWDFDKLKLYVNFVRTELNPPLNQVSELLLSKYYQFQRSNDSNHSIRTTVRLLESLVRLAQAHAKLMFHEQVQLRDAVNAIILMEASLTSSSSTSNDAGLNDLNAECPEDFESTYADFESGLLRKLEINLANIISESEDDELDHLLNEVEMTDEFDE